MIGLPKMPTAIEFLSHARGQFNSDWAVGPARWRWFDILFIHDGRVSIWLNGADQANLTGPQAILIYPDTPFVGHADTSLVTASVQHFRFTDGVQRLPECLRTLAGQSHGFELFSPEAGALAEHDVDRAIRLAEARPSASVYDMRLAMLTIVLTQLQTPSLLASTVGAGDRRLETLIQWLSERLDKRTSLDDMAGYLAMSASHFRAVFRKHCGLSPGKFLLQMRMDQAARYLAETVMPIKEVARRVGYDDVAHFYRAFKTRHGQSPGAHRRVHWPKG